LRSTDKFTLDGVKLAIHGILETDDTDNLREFLEKNKAVFFDAGKLSLDFSDSPGMDSVPGEILYQFCRQLARAGVKITRIGASKSIDTLFASFKKHESASSLKKRQIDIHDHFEDLGEGVYTFLKTLSGLWFFAGETLNAFIGMILHPLKIRWPMVFYYMEETGVKAVPIVATLTLLLGTVMGYQSGFQMQIFGAENFMPALLAYSITWEIGPMLAAVLVAGRSGSAFAAEIGTMQVRQEVDALRVMGFDTFSYLVTPKMIALLFVMPFLVLLANCSGIFGGLLAGIFFLDFPASTYISELGKALIPLDIIWGMMKSVIYAVIIANVGCFMGIRVRGGASAVGKATTAAVVLSIFLVILADALMSLLFVHIRPGLSM
jgi:phospholipid/cholesterol/gamma-HCH transport system permease protein